MTPSSASTSSSSSASILYPHQQHHTPSPSSTYNSKLNTSIPSGPASSLNAASLYTSSTPLPPIISNPQFHPQVQVPNHLQTSITAPHRPITNANLSKLGPTMNLTSVNPAITKFTSPPLSKPADDSGHSNKKRKTGIRACDGCAIRKTKCEEARPCKHCLNNGLECTDLRERKKSGPKNLRKKTIDSINSIRDGAISQATSNPDSKNDSLSPPPSLSNNSSSSAVPVSKLATADGTQGTNANANGVLVTPIVLVEILVLANHPSLSLVLKSLTIPSFLNNIPKLIEFIQISFQNKFNDINEFNSNDPIFLSKLLAILTLCLLIIENIIKFNYFNYQNFQIFNNDIFKLKNFTFFLQNKIIDTFTLINKILIFPNNLNNNFDNANVNKFHHFQINYNQSISSLHLFNYYRITSSLNNNQHFKDQQKLVNLRKAITHYQLIEISYKNDLNLIQLYELYESLYSLERLNCLLDNHLFIKNSHLILDIWNSNILSILNNDNSNSNELFALLNKSNIDNDVFNSNSIQILSKFLNINTKNLLRKDEPSVEESDNKYLILKKRLWVDDESADESAMSENSIVIVLKHILLFKSLIINASSFKLDDFKTELLDLVKNLNSLFKNLLKLTGDPENSSASTSKDDNVILKIKISNYQLLPHLLQMLKIYLDLSSVSDNIIEKDDNLVTFSNYLTQFFITYADSNKLIKSDAILNEWFITLNKINFENQTYLNNLLNDLETSVKVLASKPSSSNMLSQNPGFPSSLQLQTQSETLAQPQPISAKLEAGFDIAQSDSKGKKEEDSRANSRPQLDDDDEEDDDDDDEQFLSLPPPNLKSSSASAAAAAAVAASTAQDKSKSALPPAPSTPSRPLVNSSSSMLFGGGFSKVPSLRQMLPPTGLTPLLNSSGTFLSRNQASVTSLLPFQNSEPLAPIITPTSAIKEEEVGNLNSLSLSESTKNLYNLFNQITDDLTTTSNNNSLTNLFQFSSMASGANLASSGLGGNSISSTNINNALLNGINGAPSNGSSNGSSNTNTKNGTNQTKNQFSF